MVGTDFPIRKCFFCIFEHAEAEQHVDVKGAIVLPQPDLLLIDNRLQLDIISKGSQLDWCFIFGVTNDI